jgi:hypothetical protein
VQYLGRGAVNRFIGKKNAGSTFAHLTDKVDGTLTNQSCKPCPDQHSAGDIRIATSSG